MKIATSVHVKQSESKSDWQHLHLRVPDDVQSAQETLAEIERARMKDEE